MGAHACNSDTQVAESGGLQVQGQPVFHSEFEDSLCYTVRPCEIGGERQRDREIETEGGKGRDGALNTLSSCFSLNRRIEVQAHLGKK
jgi:hypothetical protein